MGGRDCGVCGERHIPLAPLSERVRHVTSCAFAGRRIVIFSGAAAIADEDKMPEIIGRDPFQRPKEQAIRMLGSIMDACEAAPDRARAY